MFLRYLINDKISLKNEHKMRVLISSTTSVWNIPHSKKKWGRYDRKCILVFM